MSQAKPAISVVLHDIRSAENVGSIFRTADACGVSKIYLTGYTPTPIDRFGRTRRDIVKASLGAEKVVLWEQCDSISPFLKRLRKEKIRIVAIEQDSKSVDYKKLRLQGSITLIFGNEVTGLPKSVLDHSDTVAEIHMRGMKESLNVSVAAGIVLSRLTNL